MIAAPPKGKTLRFAALIRVSTERQEEKGESLDVQKAQIESAVKHLGGRVVTWYGGHEHGTPGWDKTEVKRLLVDAERTPRPFDLVIVQHADRWSRDNVASSTGLDKLLECGIRNFYVLTDCHDLIDPNDRLRLSFHAMIGEYVAKTQSKKSIEARILRAKKGTPTAGKLPFGRTFNTETKVWGIDSQKHAMMKDIAKRYLAGESLKALAKEYKNNYANINKTLAERCGTEWEIEFNFPKLDIHEVVTFKVPRLLPERTIKACRAQSEANKTYKRGQRKTPYLLGRLVFCEHCGYTYSGQFNHPKLPKAKRYYRHMAHETVRTCPCKRKGWIGAELLESNVVSQLFEVFGNPKSVERAINAAIPNQDKVADLRSRQKRVEEALAKTANSIRRIVKQFSSGPNKPHKQVTLEMEELTRIEADQEEQLKNIKEQLEHLPSAEFIRSASQELVAQIQASKFPTKRGERKIPPLIEIQRKYSAGLSWRVEHADDPKTEMSFDDKRHLMESVFAGKLPDGRRAGVYIEWKVDDDGKPFWLFSIRGLIKLNGILPASDKVLKERAMDPVELEGDPMSDDEVAWLKKPPKRKPKSIKQCEIRGRKRARNQYARH